MQYVKLTHTDLLASRMCLGTAEYGSSIGKDDSFAMMDAFLEAGGNFLDSAHIYADWQCEIKGMSERTIGEWLASRGCRDRVIVATKGGHPDLSANVPRLATEEIRQDLRESLSRLGIEQIDLYWLHRDDISRPVGEILDTLEGLRQEGLIRWYGASNWINARLREADEYAERRRIPGMIASQIRWSLAKFNPEAIFDPTLVEMDDETYAYHLKTGKTLVAFSPQGYGFFSGKYSREHPESGRSEVHEWFGSDLNWGRLQRAEEIAHQAGCTPNQIALAYLTNQPFPTIPITGCRTMAQLMDSCAAADISLSPEQIKYLECGGT